MLIFSPYQWLGMCFCSDNKKERNMDNSGECQNDAVILRSKCSCRMVENNSRTEEGTTVEKAED